MNYDAIVIGSGCGGLSCGAALALQGKKVLVLEQSTNAGGFARTLTHDKWRWIAGFQYSGSLLPNGTDFKLLGLLTGGKLKYKPLHTEFQKIKSPAGDFSLFGDFDIFQNDLKKRFPAEANGIDEYFDILHKVREKFPDTLKERWRDRPIAICSELINSLSMLGIAFATLQKELDKRFKNENLKFILSAMWSSWGLPPEETPMMVAAGVAGTLLSGVYAPVLPDIASGLLETITKAGGKILYGEAGTAKQLTLTDKKVTGVLTADGQTYLTSAVISGIGIKRTAEQLLPEEYWKRNIKHIEKKFSLSKSAFLLRLGFSDAFRQISDGLTTYRRFADRNFNFGTDPTQAGWVPSNGVLAFTMPPTDSGLLPSAEVMGMTDVTFFSKWKNLNANQQKAVEVSMTKAILEQLVFPWFPDAAKYIEYTDLDTPITLAVDRNGYDDGAIYGLAPTGAKMMDMGIQPDSQVDNLYFTGADVITLGTTTVMIAGILAASAVVDKNLLEEYINKANAN